MNKETLKITGMTCAACSARIEKVVSKMEGVEQISVNLATEKATVSYDPSLTDISSIKAKIEKTGYGAAEIQAKKIVDEDKLAKEKEITTLVNIEKTLNLKIKALKEHKTQHQDWERFLKRVDIINFKHEFFKLIDESEFV